jgi:hypothetical protein
MNSKFFSKTVALGLGSLFFHQTAFAAPTGLSSALYSATGCGQPIGGGGIDVGISSGPTGAGVFPWIHQEPTYGDSDPCGAGLAEAQGNALETCMDNSGKRCRVVSSIRIDPQHAGPLLPPTFCCFKSYARPVRSK